MNEDQNENVQAESHDQEVQAESPREEAFPTPSREEILEARAEGVKDAIQESTKKAYLSGADQGFGDSTDQSSGRFDGSKDVFQFQHLVDQKPEELAKTLAPKDAKDGMSLTESQIAGLLEVERSGKNRTDTVKVIMDRLGITSPYEVTDAGPPYTNDTTQVSALKRN